MKKTLFLFLACLPLTVLGQVKGSWGLSGSMYFNRSDVLSVGADIDHNWTFGRHLMLSASGGLVYSALIDRVERTVDEHLYYRSEKSLLNLVGGVGLTLMQPLGRRTGLYGRGTFQFDLFPFQSIGLERSDLNGGSHDDNPSKFVFTSFSPGVFGEAGVFRDFQKRRLFVGVGYGAYDLFHSYRHHSVDGQPMSLYGPDHDTYLRVSLRLIGIEEIGFLMIHLMIHL